MTVTLAHRTRTGTGVLMAACVVLAVVSLVIPATLSYDPWAWLVWGREVGRLELDTVGGPSWKPLPVVGTTLLAPFGDLAPAIWMVVARTAGLLLLAGVYRLAASFAGPMAGAIAVGLAVLTPDDEPRLVRTVLEGHADPIGAALVVWAIERHLQGRTFAALVLGVGAALVRPEAWPFLVVYAVWLWRAEPLLRSRIVVALGAIPLLWFGVDWWGSGSPWHGAEAAQVIRGNGFRRLATSLGRVGEMVVVPAWIAGAAAVVLSWRREARMFAVIGAGALAWCASVVAMAVVFRYAALSRFLLPAAVLVCVLAGVGVVKAVGATTPGRARNAVVAGIVVVSLPFVAVPAWGLGDVVAEVRTHDRLAEDLADAVAETGGAAAVLACGAVAVEGDSHIHPFLAWQLDIPLRQVRILPATGPATLFVITGGELDQRLAVMSSARPVARTGMAAVYALGC